MTKRQKVDGLLVCLPSAVLSLVFSSLAATDWNSLGRVSSLLQTESKRADASPVQIAVQTVIGQVCNYKELYAHTFTRHHPERIALRGTCDSVTVLAVLGNQRRCQQLELRSVDFRRGANLVFSSIFSEMMVRTLCSLRIDYCFYDQDQPCPLSALTSCRRLTTLHMVSNGNKFSELVLLPPTLTVLSFRNLHGPFDDPSTIAHLCRMPLRELTLHPFSSMHNVPMPSAHFLQLLRTLAQLTTLDFDLPVADLPPSFPSLSSTLRVGNFPYCSRLLPVMLPHVQEIHIPKHDYEDMALELMGRNILHIVGPFNNSIPDAKIAPRIRSFRLSYCHVHARDDIVVPTSDFTTLATLHIVFLREMPVQNPLERFPVLPSVQDLCIHGGSPAACIPHIIRCFPNVQNVRFRHSHCRLPHCFPFKGSGSLSALEAMPSVRQVVFTECTHNLTLHLLKILVRMKKLRQLRIRKPKRTAHHTILQSLRPLCAIEWAVQRLYI